MLKWKQPIHSLVRMGYHNKNKLQMYVAQPPINLIWPHISFTSFHSSGLMENFTKPVYLGRKINWLQMVLINMLASIEISGAN